MKKSRKIYAEFFQYFKGCKVILYESIHGFKHSAGTAIISDAQVRKPTRRGYYLDLYLKGFKTPFMIRVSEFGDIDDDYATNGRHMYICLSDLIPRVTNRYNCHLLCVVACGGHDNTMARFRNHPLCDFRNLWHLIQAYVGLETP